MASGFNGKKKHRLNRKKYILKDAEENTKAVNIESLHLNNPEYLFVKKFEIQG